jgi:hypothetical protein
MRDLAWTPDGISSVTDQAERRTVYSMLEIAVTWTTYTRWKQAATDGSAPKVQVPTKIKQNYFAMQVLDLSAFCQKTHQLFCPLDTIY